MHRGAIRQQPPRPRHFLFSLTRTGRVLGKHSKGSSRLSAPLF